MSRRLWATTVCALALSFTAQAGDMDNPFKSAKVGDYASYKLSTIVGGMAIEGSLKQAVTENDGKFATLKVSGTILGMNIPAQETKIDLSKPYDPASATGQVKGNAKVKKLKEGKETIKVGDKSYECTWTTYHVVAEAGGLNLESEIKVWLTKKIPLSGMAKMEMKSKLADVVLELTEFGGK